MANDSSLAGLLDRAASVFQWAGRLGRSFQEDHSSPQWQTDPKGWEFHKPDVKQFSDEILCLREAMENPTTDFVHVVKPLREAARIARGILDVMQKREGNQWSAFLNYYPDLNSVSYEGYQAIKQAREAILAEDPFAFLDKEEETEPEQEFTAQETYPMTPEGHIKFLEWVRDEVSDLVKAKANKLERSYTNETLAGTLRGIKWEEARRRLKAFAGGSTEGLKPVADVLEMELTIGAIEYIDEQFQKAMRWLRDKIQRDKSQSNEIAIINTAGDLLLALKLGKWLCYTTSAISITPGLNTPVETCPNLADDAKRIALDHAQALLTVIGGDRAEAMEKLIARLQLQDKTDRAKIINMSLVEFVAAANQSAQGRSRNSQNKDELGNSEHTAELKPSHFVNAISFAGYLGGDQLAVALGIHESRKIAFFKRLERVRLKKLGDNSWIEPSSRQANGPQFLYRLDNPVLVKIAAAYQTQKAT